MNTHGLKRASDALCAALAAERGIDAAMFTWLRDHGLLLEQQGCPAFPVLNSAAVTSGAHVRRPAVNGERHNWTYVWFGTDKTVTPLVIGNLETALIVWLFESQWDAFAAMAVHHWHSVSAFNKTIACVITRGAQNGARIRGLIPAGKRVLAFPQNDPVEIQGKPTAAEKWLSDVAANAGSPVMVVRTPSEFKDVNDFVKAGAKLPDLQAAINAAQPAMVTPPTAIGATSLDDHDEDLDDEVVPFPTEALPPPYCDMVREVARVVGVPEAIPGMVMLAAISTAVGASISVNLLPGKTTGANIYLLPITDSGDGKSSSAQPILSPLNHIQSIRLEQWKRETRPHAEARMKLLAAEVDGLIKRAKKVLDPEQRKQLELDLVAKQTELYLAEDEFQAEPRLTCEDVTSQELARLMQRNEETMALISTDGGEVVSVLLGRYNRLDRADDALYVKSYSNEQTQVDRVGRPPILLKRPCLTVLAMIQPDKFASMLRNRQLYEGGLLARFLGAQIGGDAPDMKVGTPGIDPAVASLYTGQITKLCEDLRLGGQLHTIAADPEAQLVAVDYFNEVRAQRRGVSSRLKRFLARWAEQACRLAVVLHAAKWGLKAATTILDADTAQAGIALARWFGQQQLRLLDAGETDEQEQVITGLRNLARQKPDGFTARDVCRARICDSADEAKRYLEACVTKGLLSWVEVKTDGRPKVVYQFKGGAT